MDARDLLLIAHVVSAVVLLGPATMASSRFGRWAVLAAKDRTELPTLRTLARITRSYGVNSVATPALGVALASHGHWWSQWWVNASIGLMVFAYATLAVVISRQAGVVDTIESGGAPRRGDIVAVRAGASVFSLVWVAVLALMVLKP